MTKIDDVVESADEVFAEVIRNGQLAAGPAYPCPACGKETLEHRQGARIGESGEVEVFDRRICSNTECRTILDSAEMIEASRIVGERFQPRVIPCPACNAATKEHTDRITIDDNGEPVRTPSRICSAEDCRTVLEPGTFDPNGIPITALPARQTAPTSSTRVDGTE